MGQKKGPVVLTDDQKERFEKLWGVFPNKASKGEAKRSFLKYDPDEKELKRWIVAIRKEQKYKDYLQSMKRFCPEWKMLSTWINQECFDDEYPSMPDRRADGKVGHDYNSTSNRAPFEELPAVSGSDDC